METIWAHTGGALVVNGFLALATFALWRRYSTVPVPLHPPAVINESLPDLSPELWLSICQMLRVSELCLFSHVCADFRKLSNEDAMWKAHCLSRWQGKQNMSSDLFHHGSYCSFVLSQSEMENILRRRGLHSQHLPASVPQLQEMLGSYQVQTVPKYQVPALCKWKASYAYAELDSTRDRITVNEVAYFRWSLKNEHSALFEAPHHFRPDGVFVCENRVTSWLLNAEHEIVIGGARHALPIDRLQHNWGWMIGRGWAHHPTGNATQYESVDNGLIETTSCAMRNYEYD